MNLGLMFTSKLAAKILKARKDKGLTQDQVSSMMGVSSQTVSNWESARSIPSIDTLFKYAELTSKKMTWFFEYEEEEEEDRVKTLSNYFNSLNQSGQNLLINYAQDLSSLSKYLK